jgi:hypothetical protein
MISIFPVLSPLARLSDRLFVRNWVRLFGEPPAVLLDNRREMLDIVVETAPVLTYPVERRSSSPRPNGSGRRAEDRVTGPGDGSYPVDRKEV